MVDSLTTDQAKRIADLPKQSARLKLAKYLKWKMDEFDEELNMRESILLDYYYDNIIFAVNQGFPWSQVCEIFQLSKEIHKETKGLALLDAIKLYTIISQKYSSTVGENNLKIFTTYFFQTFMQHYKLYQFVFTNEREPMITQYKLHVNTPSECLPFKQGKEFLVWDYEKKIHDMEVKDREKKEEILKKRADLFSLRIKFCRVHFKRWMLILHWQERRLRSLLMKQHLHTQ
uniref:Uncharacterized protein C8orf74 homolog n=1 Tax=Saccoglossus kowalevskii TaxID=10224 RepID=A0ABM0M9F2_SACKO|nr:PREDICTED: uncharacterized protein C8orf74 homolog [Saccoglossus kowalevskii]